MLYQVAFASPFKGFKNFVIIDIITAATIITINFRREDPGIGR